MPNEHQKRSPPAAAASSCPPMAATPHLLCRRLGHATEQNCDDNLENKPSQRLRRLQVDQQLAPCHAARAAAPLHALPPNRLQDAAKTIWRSCACAPALPPPACAAARSPARSPSYGMAQKQGIPLSSSGRQQSGHQTAAGSGQCGPATKQRFHQRGRNGSPLRAAQHLGLRRLACSEYSDGLCCFASSIRKLKI